MVVQPEMEVIRKFLIVLISDQEMIKSYVYSLTSF